MDILMLIARINELSKKQKEHGLTDVEREEQASLRRRYLDNIRAQLTGHLDSITIAEPEKEPRA